MKTFYGTIKKLWTVHVDIETESVEEWIPLPFDINNLELQSSYLKIIMISNAQIAMSLPMTKKPISLALAQWSSPSSWKLLRLLTSWKCWVVWKKKDERISNPLSIFKIKLGKLTTYLDLVVHMFVINIICGGPYMWSYMLNTFSYQLAIRHLKAQRVCYEGEH